MKVILLTTLLVTSYAQAEAGDPIITDLRNCQAKLNNTERLSCYDDLAESLDQRIKQAERQNALAIEAAKQTATENFGRRFNTEPTEATETPKATPQAQAIIEATKEPDSIESTVTRIDKSARGNFILYLENGQVWTETSASKFRGRPKVGEVATIKKSGLGWFRLKFENTYGVMAVRRLR